jgi:hypothetical protein
MMRLTIILLLITQYSVAQLPPVGFWRQHFNSNSAIDIVATENNFFVATPYLIYSISKDDNSITQYSKVNGLAEAAITGIAYNATKQALIVAYSNGNIDVLTNNGSIININDIKRSTITVNKTIYKLFTNDKFVFACTAFGIVQIDLEKLETRDTWFLGNTGGFERVNNLTVLNGRYYAATSTGLKSIAVNSPAIANGANWPLTNIFFTGNIQHCIQFQNSIIVQRNDTLYNYDGVNINLLFANGSSIKNISANNDKLIICTTQNNTAAVITINASGTILQTTTQAGVVALPAHAIIDKNILWVADVFGSLSSFENSLLKKQWLFNTLNNNPTGQILFFNNQVLVTSGGVNNLWQYTYNRSGYASFNNEQWYSKNAYTNTVLDTVYDIHVAAYNIITNKLYLGSYGGGLVVEDNNALSVKKQNTLQAAIGDPTSYRVGGIAVDIDGNTWITNYGAINALVCIKPDGTIQKFTIPYSIVDNALGFIAIDEYNQKWIIAPKGGGVICLNTGNDVTNTSDDKWRIFNAGSSNGNLTDNEISSLAIDKQSNVWVGTYNGVSVIACADQVFNTVNCNAYQPIVQVGNFAGLLLQGQLIQSIAVDGANRKWLATQNGVFLVNAEGEKVLQQFTVVNSPLPTNDVKTIGIHAKTGEVFFGTDAGMVSYVADATEATNQFDKVKVFPNPVPKNYGGFITIQGLAKNALVKIITTDGTLVWQGVANGGTLAWNGKNYLGKQVMSGMYLILMRNTDGTEKEVGKLAIVK